MLFMVKATMKMNFLLVIYCKFYGNGKQKVNTLKVIKCRRHIAERFVMKVPKNTSVKVFS